MLWGRHEYRKPPFTVRVGSQSRRNDLSAVPRGTSIMFLWRYFVYFLDLQTNLTKMSKTLLTRREAAEMLGLAPQTLAVWAMTGKNLPVVKLGNRTTRYLLTDIMSFIAISTNGRSGNYDSNAGQIEVKGQDNG
jgi:hypothetical protein